MDILYKMAEFLANIFDGATAVIFLSLMIGRKGNRKKRNKKNKNDKKYFRKHTAGIEENDRNNNWKNDIGNNRGSNLVFLAACCLFALLNAVFQNVGEGFFLPLVCLISCNMVFECLFLRGSLGTKVIYNILYQIILMLTNMLTIYGIALVTSSEVTESIAAGDQYRLIALLANKILIVMTVIFFVMLSQRKHLEYPEWLTAILTAFGIFLSGLALIDIGCSVKMEDDAKKELLLITAGLLIITISVGFCIFKLNRMYYWKMENQLLNARAKEEESMLGKVQEMYEENRILRHDLKRYFTIANGMLETESTAVVKKYIEEVIQTRFDNKQWYHTESSVVNAVLNDVATTCSREKIPLEIKVTGMIYKDHQVAIGIILSNLLENAVEAERRITEQQSIEVELYNHKEMFGIRVSNRIEESVLDRNPSLSSGKGDTDHHGYGVKSIRKMVEELDGYLEYFEEEKMLVARAIIPIITKGA